MSDLVVNNNNDRYLGTTNSNNLDYFMNKLSLDFVENNTNKLKKRAINIKLASMGYSSFDGASLNIYTIDEFIDEFKKKEKKQRQKERK